MTQIENAWGAGPGEGYEALAAPFRPIFAEIAASATSIAACRTRRSAASRRPVSARCACRWRRAARERACRSSSTARGAIDATIDLVRNHARPWIDSGSDRTGRELDATIADVNDETIGKAKIAVAEAKVLTTEVALAAANKLFELAGTRSTLGVHNLDRFWRDARTHTLHDPVRWKFHAVGQYYLNGVQPPLHSWI